MANKWGIPEDTMMEPAAVARAFKVDPKTVTRWAKTGRLGFTRTMGGHRRYRSDDIIELLLALDVEAAPPAVPGKPRSSMHQPVGTGLSPNRWACTRCRMAAESRADLMNAGMCAGE
jgi:hypothetical protein